jgi:hypothetical protein
MLHSDLANMLTLFGIRANDAPIFPDFVPGPFAGNTGTMATADTTAEDLIKGSTPLFRNDYKLRNYAGISASGSPTGVLLLDAIGFDIAASDNTEAHLIDFLIGWSLVHIPSGSSRYNVIPLIECTRVFGASPSTTVNASSRGGGQPAHPYFRFPGGAWKINLQSDQLQLQLTSAAGTGATLDSSVKLACRARGAWVSQGAATSLGLLDANAQCSTADIPAIVAARKSLGQHNGGGGVS